MSEKKKAAVFAHNFKNFKCRNFW